MLWIELAPYDATLRKLFLATHKPDSWAGLTLTPWALCEKFQPQMDADRRASP